MNILVLSRGIPTKQDPQWGSFEYDQAKALTRLGHNIIMAAVDSRFRLRRHRWGLTITETDNIKCYNYFICPSVITKIFGFHFKHKVEKWQWRQIGNSIIHNEEKIDIIYAHYLVTSFYAVHALNHLNAPIVAIEHWSALNHEPIANEVKYLARWTYPYVAQLLTVSIPLKERIYDIWGVQSKVVHNMVGQEFSYTISTKPHPFTFISVGSLFPNKNHALLIEALHQINLPQKDWQLIIVGEGEERLRLQKQIDDAGLTQNIHLVGTKGKDDIAKLLNYSHVFVLPSRSENFSVAVLEALACGLPVIASLCGGIRECINQKNGLLFNVDDVDGLKSCLTHIYEHYADYNRQYIAEDCQARFSSEIIAQQLDSIFKETIKSHKNIMLD